MRAYRIILFTCLVDGEAANRTNNMKKKYISKHGSETRQLAEHVPCIQLVK